MVFRALSRVLQDEHDEKGVRLATIDALVDVGREGGDSHQVMIELVNALDGHKSSLRNSSIRAAAARAIGKLSDGDLNRLAEGDEVRQVLPVLIDAVSRPSEDPIVRSNAAWALGLEKERPLTPNWVSDSIAILGILVAIWARFSLGRNIWNGAGATRTGARRHLTPLCGIPFTPESYCRALLLPSALTAR